MTNGTPDSSSTPAISRNVFHEDDYTHPCHPLYVHPLDVLGTSNKLDFINGNSQKSSPTSPLARQWQRCNDLVISWLVNSLSKEISRSAEYSEFARKIWNKLEERYGKADGVRVFELKKELAHISRGSLDIASYFNKIKQLWDEIASISAGRTRVCSCGAKSAEDEEQRAYQQSYPSKVNFESSKPNVTCKYCKKPGHTTEKCYKLHGYPPSFKFTKTPNIRKTAAHVELTNHPEFGTGDIPTEHGTLPQSEDMSAIAGLTKDQYSQLMMLLQQSHLSHSPSNSSLMGSANFAGELIPPGVSYGACMLTKVDVKVTNIVSLALLPDLILHNVLYVPSFQYNLISVHKLLSHSDDMVQFTKAACTLQGPSVRKPVVLVSNSSVHASVIDECSPLNIISAIDDMNKAEVVWHYRLGHIPFSKLKTISALDSFGCLCYSTITKLHKDKFSPRSIPCVFVGYPFAKKGYELCSLTSKTCFISRDVIFLEHIFPFFKASNQPSHILSSPLSTCFDTDCSVPPPSTSPASSSSIDPPSPILHPAPTSPHVSHASSPPDSSHIDHSVPVSSSPLPTLRRSSRPHNPPSYLNSYVCQSSSSNSISVPSIGQLHIPEPHSYSQAATILEWQDAMRK
ncbi:PREDICTED: uncharacterized protein LOC109205435 [Nicotiana attenuata]|uniref:uncharacterized protein LOC109205435 n=1 Tax=Nicotiana attenuata TaxID=49451 RepID=UPI0009055990|nr:PREDICTED: uncharacterized protein LOC109205435 [Nicotiana attenuata]